MAQRAAVIDQLSDRTAVNQSSLTVQAIEHYRNAMTAQREGNWARYGEEIERLGQVLEQLRPE
jgi:uncharacterized membrane protein (UPF0182 family)